MLKKLLLLAFLPVASHLFSTPAPDFTITDSDGNVRHLYADYVNQGKVVVLEIFFIACPPCTAHAPYWKTLYDSVKVKYPGQVEFMMLSDKSGDLNSAVAQYKISKSLTMPAAGADGGSLNAVQPYKSGQFGPFYGTPTFVIIAPGTGEVTYDVRGNDPAETIGLIGQEIAGFFLPKCLIKTYQGDTLKNYHLNVAVPGGVSAEIQVANGEFSLENFPGLPNASFYLATPSKTDNPLNGVSTFDLVQINKQILGIDSFAHPWQIIAADANNSGTLTTFDIVELRKLILGIYDTLPSAPSWVFSPAQDTISPLSCPELLAIKIGDVNGNADAAGIGADPEDRNGREFPLVQEHQFLKAGNTYALNLMAGAPADWQGVQAAFACDPGLIAVKKIGSSILPDFNPENWHLTRGRLAISWNGRQSIGIPEGTAIFTIDVQVLRDCWSDEAFVLANDRIRPEAYDAAGDRFALKPQSTQTYTGSIRPNPAKGAFVLEYSSAREQATVLQLIDIQGKPVFEMPVQLLSGPNTLKVHPGSIAPGVYQIRLNGEYAGRLLYQE